MEAAAVKGFTKVSKTVLDLVLKSLGISVPSRPQQKAGQIIQACRQEWGWTDVDVARAMRHTLPDFKPSSASTTAAQEQSPDIPQDVLDLAHEFCANEDGQQDGEGGDAAQDVVELPGIGPVNATLLQALTQPALLSPAGLGPIFCVSVKLVKQGRHPLRSFFGCESGFSFGQVSASIPHRALAPL